MRRKPGQLLDLEARILTAMTRGGAMEDQVHGFALARSLSDQAGSRGLTSHGTLYKALARLEAAGALSSRWEESATAEHEGRPRRRLYRVTADGRALLRAHQDASADRRRLSGDLGIQWR
jgi:DNA-binding PadR family transcriptional regulator